MAYSEFTLDRVANELGVTLTEGDLFAVRRVAIVPDWLPGWLGRGTRLALMSEKSRSEFIVVPILLAARELSGERVAIFSGVRFDVDPGRELSGECDFILALGPSLPPLRAPVITVVEARKNDIESGLGQCVAQMVAAGQFNAGQGRASVPVYGCVTTGQAWQFLRLDQGLAMLDRQPLFADNLAGILGMLMAIIDGST